MSKSINILDKDYLQWIKELGSRYHRSQIKAAVKVNEEMLRFYWELVTNPYTRHSRIANAAEHSSKCSFSLGEFAIRPQ